MRQELTGEERKRGFVRPLRDIYHHAKCRRFTKIETSLAEAYARDPSCRTSEYCPHCEEFFPVSEFMWSFSFDGRAPVLGS